jgi:peptidoglycan/xylan/chitin deacetylase (PgdA/CDA1 family)
MKLRSAIKEAAYGVAAASGLPRLAGAHRGRGLIVLTYHSVGPAAEHPYLHRMPPDRFRAQLRYLKTHYDVVPVVEGLDRLALRYGSLSSHRPMAAVTVDDGYADNYEHIFPIAREQNVPITIFVATDYLDSGRLPWPTRISALTHFASANRCYVPASEGSPVSLPIVTAEGKHAANRALRQALSKLDQPAREAALEELTRALAPVQMRLLPPLTWDQVREMQESSVVFGSHTCHHAWLDRVSAGELERELSVAKARIEAETAQACDTIAYPNGNHDEKVRAATARAGYRYALTQTRGINTECFEPLSVRRIEVPYNELLGTFICRVAGLTT